MALDPQSKDLLAKLTVVAKKIVYNPDRMKQFMQMMGTPDGAITAVQSVISVIEQKTDIPPNILPLLGINIYMVMVDVAQAATKLQPDAGIMKAVIAKILQQVPSAQQNMEKDQPQGIVAPNMGVPA
jgi:hypothetical protein